MAGLSRDWSLRCHIEIGSCWNYLVTSDGRALPEKSNESLSDVLEVLNLNRIERFRHQRNRSCHNSMSTKLISYDCRIIDNDLVVERHSNTVVGSSLENIVVAGGYLQETLPDD